MRDRKTVIDRPLTEVLNNQKEANNQKHAKALVSRVQRHYEHVRSMSLRSVRTPGTLLDTAIDRLHKFDTNLPLNKPVPSPSRTSSA
jgi:hypothetical protein